MFWFWCLPTVVYDTHVFCLRFPVMRALWLTMTEVHSVSPWDKCARKCYVGSSSGNVKFVNKMCTHSDECTVKIGMRAVCEMIKWKHFSCVSHINKNNTMKCDEMFNQLILIYLSLNWKFKGGNHWKENDHIRRSYFPYLKIVSGRAKNGYSSNNVQKMLKQLQLTPQPLSLKHWSS